MFGVPVGLRSRALAIAFALAIGLAALAAPAATPVSAVEATDLEMHATATYTLSVNSVNKLHRMIVDLHGDATLPANSVVVTASFPPGIRPVGSSFQVSNTLTTWSCTFSTASMVCRNTSPFVAHTGAPYFRVGLAVSGPVTGNVVSTVDPFGTVHESNEGNNTGVTTYHFT